MCFKGEIFFCNFCSDSPFTYTPSPQECIPSPRRNNTIITDVYNGIPENLLLNFIGFVVSFIGFIYKKVYLITIKFLHLTIEKNSDFFIRKIKLNFFGGFEFFFYSF